jgi:hypothetical protein
MNSCANDSFDPTHSSDSGSDGIPDSSSVYIERCSARSTIFLLFTAERVSGRCRNWSPLEGEVVEVEVTAAVSFPFCSQLFETGPEGPELED